MPCYASGSNTGLPTDLFPALRYLIGAHDEGVVSTPIPISVPDIHSDGVQGCVYLARGFHGRYRLVLDHCVAHYNTSSYLDDNDLLHQTGRDKEPTG